MEIVGVRSPHKEMGFTEVASLHKREDSGDSVWSQIGQKGGKMSL